MSSPAKDTFAPSVKPAESQNDQKDEHVNESQNAQALFLKPLQRSAPREKENRLNIKDNEQDGKQVVDDAELNPSRSFRWDTALVSHDFVRRRLEWTEQPCDAQNKNDGENAKQNENGNEQVVPRYLMHFRSPKTAL